MALYDSPYAVEYASKFIDVEGWSPHLVIYKAGYHIQISEDNIQGQFVRLGLLSMYPAENTYTGTLNLGKYVITCEKGKLISWEKSTDPILPW